MKTYLRLIKYSRPYIYYFLGSVLCTIILSGATGAIAYLVEPAIDDIFKEKNFSMLYFVPVLLAAMYFIKGAADFGQHYLIGYVGGSVVTDLRDAVYRHILTLPLSFFTKTSTGIIISRINNDVTVLFRTVSSSVMKVIKNFFVIIALAGVAFYQDWKVMLACLIFFPPLVFLTTKLGKKARKYSRRGLEKVGRVSTLLDETISGSQTVKSFCMEGYEVERFKKESFSLLKNGLKSLQVAIITSPVMEIFGGFLISAIIYYGGTRVLNGQMTAGKFFSFVAALAMLYKPIKIFAKENIAIQVGVAAAIRIFEVLDLVPEIADKDDSVLLPRLKDSIEFRDVSFQYEDTPVLKKISFEVKKGEILAVVGHSGVGKSTLANLLLRFYDVNEGGIYFDGLNIKDVQIKSLRDQIAFVTQETLLFNDTIRNNIAYGGRDISEEKIISAAKAANIHDFIISLPAGYDTLTGEKGKMLSGGQCQRISIARAIVKDAPILLLDEATSSLDSRSENEVQKALENLMENRTSFVIAHRLSTIRNADKIIVMSDGEIIEEGSHNDLIEHKGVYNTLINIQNGYSQKTEKSSTKTSPEEEC